jgi:hypothetical protein
MLLYYFLYALVAVFTYIWYTREYLTLQEVDKKVSKLDKTVTKINKDLEEQQQKMKEASSQASQAQALLAVNKS